MESHRPALEFVYQLKVTLKRVRPAVWRRLQVPADITLGDLHLVLQDSLGWTNSHLHQFLIDGTDYGESGPEYDFTPTVDEREVRLRDVARKHQQFRYDYDFGDSWEHEIVVERVQRSDPNRTYPVCLAGRRACPPEDCGGSGGYAELLKILADPSHEEHAERLAWLGGTFDPEEFDLAEISERLASPRSSGTDWTRY